MKRALMLLFGAVAALLPLLMGAMPAAAAPSPAHIRIIYVAAQGPANVDAYIDGTRYWSQVPYKGVTAYFRVAGASHDLAIRRAGSGAAGAVLGQVQQAMDADSYYTVVVADKAGEIRVAVFPDGYPQQTAGKAVARFVHTAPEVPGVDVGVQGSCTPVVFQNIAFMQGSPYAVVDGGSYDLELRGAGNCNQRLFQANGVQLAAGTVSTVVALGGEGRPIEAMKVLDAASAVNAPNGGATTGLGGLARGDSPLPALLALALLAALWVAGAARLRTA